MFLLHYNQMGGNRRNQQLPINILQRGPLKYFRIDYNQQNNFYDFFQEQIVEDFLDSVYNIYVSDTEYKIQGYAEIINQQQGQFLIAECTRVWLTNNYTARYFNNYVRNSIKREIVKRIIVNDLPAVAGILKDFKGKQY